MSPFRRIQLAIAYPASEVPLIALLQELIAENGTEIRVIYVEDTDLLRLADLACAREIGSASARTSPLRRIDLARSLQRHAARIESQLEHQLSQEFTERDASLCFEVVSGTVASVACARAGDADVTVLLQATSTAFRAAGLPTSSTHSRAAGARPSTAVVGRAALPASLPAPLLVLPGSGSTADQRVIGFAERLSRSSGHPLRIARPLAPAGDAPGAHAAEAADLSEVVRHVRPWALVASAATTRGQVRQLVRLGSACEVGVFMVS